MITRLKHLLFGSPGFQPAPKSLPTFAITETCITGMMRCMKDDMEKNHEGVCYLLGLTSKSSTLAVSTVHPNAQTTRGSFDVDHISMSRVMRCAADTGLHVVGQAHTHPGAAYHSEGDVEGARIAYSGYVSLVFPEYGRWLPSCQGAACYVYHSNGFVELNTEYIKVIKEVSE